MPDILFYHLLRSPIENALRDLLSKCQERGLRVLVLGTSTQDLNTIDDKLWALDNGFMPHGVGGTEHDVDQPILLTPLLENKNQASILMLIHGARIAPEQAQGFDRVCLLFDGADDVAVDQARQDWKRFSEADLPLQYWSQENGAWELKAKSA